MLKVKKLFTMVMLVMAFTFTNGLVTNYISGDGAVFAAGDCGATKSEKAVLSPEKLKACEGVDDINQRIFGFAKVVAGIVLGFAVLMIVYAGFKYTTSQGDPKVTEQAKMQIVSAGIGIGIAMLAFIIVKVFENLM
jgi:heme/copper-type cytochrome/quinol oxidase subunit 2